LSWRTDGITSLHDAGSQVPNSAKGLDSLAKVEGGKFFSCPLRTPTRAAAVGLSRGLAAAKESRSKERDQAADALEYQPIIT